MKTILKTLIITLVYLLMSAVLIAAPAGYLVVEEGIIKLRSNMQDRIIRAGDDEVQVLASDEIQTGKSTRVKLYLNDKNETISLYSNTFFKVSTVTDEESEVSMPIGKIRCLIKPTFAKLNNIKRKFRVRTLTAVIGVKGTDFVTQSDGSTTNLLTIDGTVGLANITDPEVEVDVTQNQASKAVKGETPTPPVDVPPDVVESIVAADTGEAWEGVDFGEPEAQDETTMEEQTETGMEEAIPPLEDLIPEDIDEIRDTVSEVQSGAGTASTEGTITITIEEQ